MRKGYNKAARSIELVEQQGIISMQDHNSN
ncbi:hypothetical protein GKR63_16945 [Providencia sp. wls1921]|nr:hypothetical protein [Providencia sp. wls1921]